MLPALGRLPEVRRLVSRRQYFFIHAPRIFAGNPMHKGFCELRWIGFQSLVNGSAKYWIDEFVL